MTDKAIENSVDDLISTIQHYEYKKRKLEELAEIDEKIRVGTILRLTEDSSEDNLRDIVAKKIARYEGDESVKAGLLRLEENIGKPTPDENLEERRAPFHEDESDNSTLSYRTPSPIGNPAWSDNLSPLSPIRPETPILDDTIDPLPYEGPKPEEFGPQSETQTTDELIENEIEN